MKQAAKSRSGRLTPADLAGFSERGYLLLGKILSDQVIAELFRFLASLTPRPQDKDTLFFTQLRGTDTTLAQVAAHGLQVAALTSLIGPNLRCWFDQFVVKLPRTAAGVFPWHQDNGYNAPDPDNNVTVWIALDQTTLDNGCIWVIPGSHKKGLIPHKKKSEDSWHIEVDTGEAGIPVLLRPGEAVAFTGYTLHRSLGNQTDQPRRAFFLEYCDADARFSDGTPINQRQGPDLFAGGLSPVIAGTSKYG